MKYSETTTLTICRKKKKSMGKLGFFVVGNSKGKFGKDGCREVCTHVAWYRKATGADLGQGQDDRRETKQDCVHGACQFTEALLGDFQGAVLTMSESSDFQLTSFLLHPEMLASRLHFL